METERMVRWSCARSETYLSSLEFKLTGLGYAPSTIALYMRACRRFSLWLSKRRHLSGGIWTASIDAFLEEHLSNCKCHPPCPARHTSRAALNHLRRMCGSEDDNGIRVENPVQTELEEFHRYLCDVCGLCEATCRYRTRYVAEFLDSRFGPGRVDTAALLPRHLMEYVSSRVRTVRPGTGAVIASSIRSYLKFLQLRGDVDSNLARVIPTVPVRRLADYPVVLSEDQVNRLLSTFDLSTPAGMRDHAMALCMLHLGMRAGEVANLDLEDIDWRESVVRLVKTKTRRSRLLPLPTTCGISVARYLEDGRPISQLRRVFLRHTVPVGVGLAAENVRGAMRRAYGRAGFPPQWTGTHLLRHTAATMMLNRGTPLKELADVLGHRSIDTTAIYTKVHIAALKMVTLPWPEVRS